MNLQSSNTPVIHFAPLQGYTDFAYRKAYQKQISNVDVFYSPYLSINNEGTIDSLNDIEVYQPNLIPQILPGNFADFKSLIETVKSNGYERVNLNMGCPYPMVTKRGRGSALIRKHDLVKDFIDYANDFKDLKLSLKMRSGLEENEEIFNLLEKIPIEKVEYVIVHPRIAAQLYKGEADVKIVKRCAELYPQITFIYNGDIKSYDDYLLKKGRLENQNHWMIGRGLLQNPFLAWQIKNDKTELPIAFAEQLMLFINEIIHQIERDSKNEGHALNRCKNQLGYLLHGFPEYHKTRKKIEKSRSIEFLKENLKGIENNTNF